MKYLDGYLANGQILGEPVVTPEGVVITGSADGHLYALRLKEGAFELLDQIDIRAPLYGSPQLMRDGVILFTASNKNLYAAKLDSKHKLRLIAKQQITKTKGDTLNWPIAVDEKDYIYYINDASELLALKLEMVSKTKARFKVVDKVKLNITSLNTPITPSSEGRLVFSGGIYSRSTNKTEHHFYVYELLNDHFVKTEEVKLDFQPLGFISQIRDQEFLLVLSERRERYPYGTRLITEIIKLSAIGKVASTQPLFEEAIFGASQNAVDFVYPQAPDGALFFGGDFEGIKVWNTDPVAVDPKLEKIKVRGSLTLTEEGYLFFINDLQELVVAKYDSKAKTLNLLEKFKIGISTPGRGIALDSKGNLYVGSDDFRIYAFDLSSYLKNPPLAGTPSLYAKQKALKGIPKLDELESTSDLMKGVGQWVQFAGAFYEEIKTKLKSSDHLGCLSQTLKEEQNQKKRILVACEVISCQRVLSAFMGSPWNSVQDQWQEKTTFLQGITSHIETLLREKKQRCE